jgi:hypothetical protein
MIYQDYNLIDWSEFSTNPSIFEEEQIPDII